MPRAHTLRDRLGVEINLSDTVMVTAWGTARLIDTGVKSPVVRINRTRVVIIDSDGCERAVRPTELCVQRRDGQPGHEGNRPAERQCTCGAVHHSGCFCNLTPREFHASKES